MTAPAEGNKTVFQDLYFSSDLLKIIIGFSGLYSPERRFLISPLLNICLKCFNPLGPTGAIVKYLSLGTGIFFLPFGSKSGNSNPTSRKISANSSKLTSSSNKCSPASEPAPPKLSESSGPTGSPLLPSPCPTLGAFPKSY